MVQSRSYMSLDCPCIRTYYGHLLGLDKRVEGPVGDDLAAVGAAVGEVHLVQVQRATGRQCAL